MSETYKAMYKCRLCGELYDGLVRTGKNVAEATIMAMLTDQHSGFPAKTNIHYCFGIKAIGISDFVGWKEEKTE